MNNKERRQSTIRVNVLKHGCWAHNNKCGVLANTKSEAIAEIKKQFPGEYLVVDIAAEHVCNSNIIKITEGSNNVFADIGCSDPEMKLQQAMKAKDHAEKRIKTNEIV